MEAEPKRKSTVKGNLIESTTTTELVERESERDAVVKREGFKKAHARLGLHKWEGKEKDVKDKDSFLLLTFRLLVT